MGAQQGGRKGERCGDGASVKSEKQVFKKDRPLEDSSVKKSFNSIYLLMRADTTKFNNHSSHAFQSHFLKK